ncbi:MAG TPA: ribosome assembly cofactor RimP, partial [Flavobacteriaceae bacterium]|nr:ribosome assembly cofactor RimP [Flavobacteriaceae bacterium]
MRKKVEELLNQALAEKPSLFLIDLSISEANQIRVVLDGDQGVSVQDCIDVSRAIEHNL